MQEFENKFNFHNGYFKYFRLAWENILYPGTFKIDFIVVGAQKSGTSSLDKYLRDHPQINMPRWKELHYFNHDRAFKNNSQPNLRGFYHIKNRFKMYGEVTPSYLYWDTAIKRIKEHNPNAKIIAILREPVSRAYSHWNMQVARDAEARSFRECIETEIEQIQNGTIKIERNSSYVHRGMYGEQIKRVYEHFPMNQVLFIKYDNFLSQQHETLDQIFSFLKVKKVNSIPEFSKLNSIAYPSSIAQKDKELLKAFFQPTISEVEDLLSWNCNDWRK